MKTHEMTDAEFERYLARNKMTGLAAANAGISRRRAKVAFNEANEKAAIKFRIPAGNIHGVRYVTAGTVRTWYVFRSISVAKPWQISGGAGRNWTGFADLDEVRAFVHCRDVDDRAEAERLAALPKPVFNS